MRSPYAAVSGAVLAVVHVLLSGLLEIRARGMRLGVALDLGNEVSRITGVRSPWLPASAIAVLGLLVALALLVGATRIFTTTAARAGLLAAFAATCLVLTVWGFVIDSRVSIFDPDGTGVGIATGVEGWVQEGGQVSAVHVVALLALAAALLLQRADTAPESPRT